MKRDEPHEITDMLPRMREGDPDAVALIWQNYFQQLVRYARRRLDGLKRGAADEEDVALSAMFSLCQGMEEGRFDKVGDRQDLWRLLLTITARKACARRRHDFADQRDDRRTKREGSMSPGFENNSSAGDLAQFAGPPTPDMADEVLENCQKLLGCLDETSRQIALWRLEGHSKAEIAKKLGCVKRTVERKLERIREKWAQLGAAPKPR